MTPAADVPASDGGTVAPLTLQQRKARGFCVCALNLPYESGETPDVSVCEIHPQQMVYADEYNHRRGLFFFDDRRNRYVSWPDAVEGMRQPRYAGASSPTLVLFTWMNLMRMLEALCYPARDAAAVITETAADQLIAWAEQHFPPDELGSLIGFARGGGGAALCAIFRRVALNGPAQRVL
ncbi:MAG: hypothetical protein P3C09_11585 [Gemmatimonadota bacterium]|nr:hypothetical protein [Gemmatimonadota bacterium]MDQ8168388.1 hypothetical protein [Gemmatimonadota bacterium]